MDTFGRVGEFKSSELDEAFSGLLEAQSEVDRQRTRTRIVGVLEQALEVGDYEIIGYMGQRMTRKVIESFGTRHVEKLYQRLTDEKLRREIRIIGHYLLARLYRGYDGRGAVVNEVAAFEHYKAAAQLGHLVSETAYMSMLKRSIDSKLVRGFYSLWLPFFFIYIAIRIRFVGDPSVSLYRSHDVFPVGGKIDQVIARRGSFTRS